MVARAGREAMRLDLCKPSNSCMFSST